MTAADDTDTRSEQVEVALDIAAETSSDFDLTVIDDEQTFLATTAYPMLFGGTQVTKRQNVRWGTTRLGVVGFDAAGDTVIGSNTRDLDDPVVGPAVASGGGGPFGVESIEFDGTDFGFFVTSGMNIGFARAGETAASTLQITNVASNALNFWPVWNGAAYGLVYRDHAPASDRLRFVQVSPTGVASNLSVLTVVDGTDDVQPNLHFTGAGYTVLYSSAGEVRCLRTRANGSLIAGSDRALAGFPAQGTFLSSVYDGTDIVAAYFNATNSINMVRIAPATCTVVGSHQAIGPAGVYSSSPPVLAYNGLEFALAYDFVDGAVERVAVMLVSPSLQLVDSVVVGDGTLPSLTWAGDRWAVRYGDPVQVTVGSFSTLCSDGLLDQDETQIDCGGSLCQPCN